MKTSTRSIKPPTRALTSLRAAVLLLLAGAGMAWPQAQVTLEQALSTPTPNPPPPRSATQLDPDERLALSATAGYRRDLDPNGLFPKYDELVSVVSNLQARVYQTNTFLASLHNYHSKVEHWLRREHLAELRSVVDFVTTQRSGDPQVTNQPPYGTLRSLVFPVCASELLADENLTGLVLEAVRIQLRPPVRMVPPCVYICDDFLGLPSATNLALRLPADPPPNKEAIASELAGRVKRAREMMLALKCNAREIAPIVTALKYDVKATLVEDMWQACQQVDAPKELNAKLQDALWLKARLPRRPPRTAPAAH